MVQQFEHENSIIMPPEYKDNLNPQMREMMNLRFLGNRTGFIDISKYLDRGTSIGYAEL